MTELFRPTALAIQKLFNQFDPAAGRADPALADGRLAPIFLVGPPRSGSTLVFQALCRCLEVSYISNVMSLLPRFMTRLAPFNLDHAAAPGEAFHPGDYGFLPGLFAPSEAGKIMDKWFAAGSDERFRDAVRRSFAGIGQRTGRPLLVKCPSLVLKLDRVLQTLPGARIIVLTREPAFVIQSLMLAKNNPGLAADRWEGIEPPGSDLHRGDCPEAEIAWQIAEITCRIEQDVSRAKPGHVARMSYEEFCAEPARAVRMIAAELSLDCAVEGLPERFEMSRSRRVSDESWGKIVAACRANGLGQPIA